MKKIQECCSFSYELLHFFCRRWLARIPPGGAQHFKGGGDKSGELCGWRAETQRAGRNVGGAGRRGAGRWDR